MKVKLSILTTNVEVMTPDAGGGVWEYGKNWSHTIAYSNYLHPYNVHSSAVIVGDLKISSGPTSAGEWALASAEPRWGVTEEFYYANDEN